MQSEAEIERG